MARAVPILLMRMGRRASLESSQGGMGGGGGREGGGEEGREGGGGREGGKEGRREKEGGRREGSRNALSLEPQLFIVLLRKCLTARKNHEM